MRFESSRLFRRFVLFGFWALCVATLGVAPALASVPGDRIVNTVTVSYQVDSVDQDPESDDAAFVVDRKVDMQVVQQATVTAQPNDTDQQLTFKIMNEGNHEEIFDIDVFATGTLGSTLTLETDSNTLDAGEYRVYISADASFDGSDVIVDPDDATYAPADPAVGSPISTLIAYDDTASDNDDFYIFIFVHIPGDAADKDVARFSVRAAALDEGNTSAKLAESTSTTLDNEGDPSAAEDTVFADGAGTTDSEAGDAVEDGVHTDNSTITIASADLTVTKTVTIVNSAINNDPNAATQFVCASEADPGIDDATQGAIPGACLEYTISITNASGASESAQTVVISDPLPTGVTFSAFQTTSTTWTTRTHNAGTVAAELDGSLGANSTAELTFRVTVD